MVYLRPVLLYKVKKLEMRITFLICPVLFQILKTKKVAWNRLSGSIPPSLKILAYKVPWQKMAQVLLQKVIEVIMIKVLLV